MPKTEPINSSMQTSPWRPFPAIVMNTWEKQLLPATPTSNSTQVNLERLQSLRSLGHSLPPLARRYAKFHPMCCLSHWATGTLGQQLPASETRSHAMNPPLASCRDAKRASTMPARAMRLETLHSVKSFPKMAEAL